MGDRYQGFEKSLIERRTYRDSAGYLDDLRKSKSLAGKFDIRYEGADVIVTGSHVMNSGHPGLGSVFKSTFRVAPPPDFVDFYEKWNGGILFLGVPYRLLDMASLVAENLEFRRLRGHTPDAEWKIIRFADLGHNDFVGYRKRAGEWVVCLILNEYHDDDLLSGTFEAPTLARSFSDWIERITRDDGALPDGIPVPMKRIA